MASFFVLFEELLSEKKCSLKKYDNGVELLLYSFRMMFEGV
jgi:hypothetical protein